MALRSPPEGFTFNTEIRVRYAETDAQTVVYHANYLIYFEVARVSYADEVLRARSEPRDKQVDILLAHCEADFSSSAHFDDRLEVWARIARLGRTSYDFHYVVRLATSGELLCKGKTTQVFIDSTTRRPVELPAKFVERVKRYERI